MQLAAMEERKVVPTRQIYVQLKMQVLKLQWARKELLAGGCNAMAGTLDKIKKSAIISCLKVLHTKRHHPLKNWNHFFSKHA
jgi:hypothetical protein